MRPSFILLCVFAILGGTGCSTELPLPPAGPAKLALIGELIAGDSLQVRGGKSISLQTGGVPPEVLSGIQVTVQEDPGGAPIPLAEHWDPLSYTLFTLPYSSAVPAAADKRYTVSAKHPSYDAVSASVYVPTPFTATPGAQSVAWYNGDSVLKLDISISDPQAANRQFVIEAFRQPITITRYFTFNGTEYLVENFPFRYDSLRAAGVPTFDRNDTLRYGGFSRVGMYTDDPLSENAVSGRRTTMFRRIFLSGKVFSGNAHQTRIYILRRDLFEFSTGLAETVIRVKSVAPDYYEFLKKYEPYSQETGFGTNPDPNNLPGNVKGGYGMVGGVFQRKISLVF